MSEQQPTALIKKGQFSMSPPEVAVARVRPHRPGPHDSSSSVNLNDILFALFKHKKKVVLGAIVGLLVATAVFFLYPDLYESDAKLLVRYLVERRTIDTSDNSKNPGGYAPATDTVIRSEVEILNSWDLAVQTAEAIGPKRLLPRSKGTPTKEAAAGTIISGLTLTTAKGSNIIFVSYKNRDPALATLVLNELVNRYFIKHLEVHRSAGAFDFVTQQTDQVRSRLNQTEDALRDLREKAGIVSLTDTTTALSNEAGKVEEQLHLAEAEAAEQEARIKQINGSVGGITILPGDDVKSPSAEDKTTSGESMSEGSTKPEPQASPSPRVEAPPEVVQKYQVLVKGLEKLRQKQLDLFGKYTPESQMVKANQSEIDDVDRELRNLETAYPDLVVRVGRAVSSKGKQADPGSEVARLAGLRAKKNALAARLKDIRNRIREVSQLAPQFQTLNGRSNWKKQITSTSKRHWKKPALMKPSIHPRFQISVQFSGLLLPGSTRV